MTETRKNRKSIICKRPTDEDLLHPSLAQLKNSIEKSISDSLLNIFKKSHLPNPLYKSNQSKLNLFAKSQNQNKISNLKTIQIKNDIKKTKLKRKRPSNPSDSSSAKEKWSRKKIFDKIPTILNKNSVVINQFFYHGPLEVVCSSPTRSFGGSSFENLFLKDKNNVDNQIELDFEGEAEMKEIYSEDQPAVNEDSRNDSGANKKMKRKRKKKNKKLEKEMNDDALLLKSEVKVEELEKKDYLNVPVHKAEYAIDPLEGFGYPAPIELDSPPLQVLPTDYLHDEENVSESLSFSSELPINLKNETIIPRQHSKISISTQIFETEAESSQHSDLDDFEFSIDELPLNNLSEKSSSEDEDEAIIKSRLMDYLKSKSIDPTPIQLLPVKKQKRKRIQKRKIATNCYSSSSSDDEIKSINSLSKYIQSKSISTTLNPKNIPFTKTMSDENSEIDTDDFEILNSTSRLVRKCRKSLKDTHKIFQMLDTSSESEISQSHAKQIKSKTSSIKSDDESDFDFVMKEERPEETEHQLPKASTDERPSSVMEKYDIKEDETENSGSSDSESDSTDSSLDDDVKISVNKQPKKELIDLGDLSDTEVIPPPPDKAQIKKLPKKVIVKKVVHKRRKKKSEEDESLNKRYGNKKLRYRPARPRNYAYRKHEWQCPICLKVMKYGSRFLHLQAKHDRPYLCRLCPYRCKMPYILRRHVIKNHGIIHSNKLKCNHCHRSFCYKATLQRHMSTQHSKKIFTLNCAICSKKFFTSIELGQHYKEIHPGDKKFKCNLCDCSYAILNSLKHHKIVKHNPTGELPHKCDKCDLQFVRKDKLKVHQMRHMRIESKKAGKFYEKEEDRKCPHIKPTLKGKNELLLCDHCGHICEYCSYRFQSHRQFALHTHNNFCGMCVRKYKDEKEYSLHIAYHEPNNEIGYRCEICKFGFVTIRSLNIHAVKMHNMKMKMKEFKCTICGKTFQKENLLSIHIKLHMKKKKHSCPWCSESYITTTLLNFHIQRIHTKERPFKCNNDKCKKEFLRKTDLNRHSKIHSTEDDPSNIFICNICDKRLKSNRNLQLHLKIHESERKGYQCKVCGKKYAQKGYLKLHCMVHDEEGLKQYPCGYCNKSYLKEQGLSEHLVSVHGFKSGKWKCDLCKKGFSSQTGYSKHVRHGTQSCNKRKQKINSNRKVV